MPKFSLKNAMMVIELLHELSIFSTMSFLKPRMIGHEPLMEAALVDIDKVLASGYELCHLHRHLLLFLIKVILLHLLTEVGILWLYETDLVAAVHIP
jgi:hypothetical protein